MKENGESGIKCPEMTATNPMNPAKDDATKSRSLWPQWALLVLFIFLAFECTLLAVSVKGSWFILLAPGVVCGVKAYDTWRELRRRLDRDQD